MTRARVLAHEPPVFFNRGPSPAARCVLFSLLALSATVLDYRFHALAAVRQVVASALYPVQWAISRPFEAWDLASAYLVRQDELIRENQALKQQAAERAAQAQRLQSLADEHAHLKALVGAPERLNTTGVVAEIVHVARSPFNRKLVLNRGASDQVRAGLPVIEGAGLVGQVTAVTPFSSEVTLITDKDQAVPVMVARNGLRALAYGSGRDQTLVLPFLGASADIHQDDELVTSGIDGTYPPGLAVAVVSEVERAGAPFLRVTARPTARVDRHRYLMVLTTPPSQGYPQAAADTAAKEIAESSDTARRNGVRKP